MGTGQVGQAAAAARVVPRCDRRQPPGGDPLGHDETVRVLARHR